MNIWKWFGALVSLFFSPLLLTTQQAGEGGGDSESTDADSDTSSTSDKPDPTKNKTDGGMSQDEVNKLVGKTRKDARSTAESELLQKLGVKTLDEAVEALTAERKRKESELSETERLQKALEKAEATAKESVDALVRLEEAGRLDRRNTAVKTTLRDANVRKEDAEDAFFLMEKRGLLENLLDKDGKLDEKAVNAAVEAFKKDKAAYFTPGGAGSRSNSDGRVSSPKTQFNKAVAKERKRHFT